MSPAGRPLKFTDVQTLEKRIEGYFKDADKRKAPYTVTGLAVFLDTSRETLMNYEEREEFFATIKKAKDRCQLYLEENALNGKLSQPMAIFSMKNNYGWRDQQHIDHTNKGEKFIPILSGGSVQRDDGDQKAS